jgi:hypothetical protein
MVDTVQGPYSANHGESAASFYCMPQSKAAQKFGRTTVNRTAARSHKAMARAAARSPFQNLPVRVLLVASVRLLAHCSMHVLNFMEGRLYTASDGVGAH